MTSSAFNLKLDDKVLTVNISYMQPWVIPTVQAGTQVIKHRNEIRNLWDQFINLFAPKNIRWQSFYTCSRIEAFEWNKERHMTTLVDENQRDKLLKDFLTSITNYCRAK